MIALLLCLMLDNGPAWEIASTGIFQPLKKDEVIISPAGEVFILNYNEALISHYDQSGRFKQEIGFKGQGPGGLIFPWSFFLEAGHLFVHDRGNDLISIFDEKGRFARSIHLPQRGLALFKVSNGWVYGDWQYTTSPNEPAQVIWVDQNFENPVKLLSLEEKGTASGLTINNTGNETVAMLTLVGNTPHMVASGNRVYVAEAEGLNIHVFDVFSKKEIRKIRRRERALPFDHDWAEETRAALQKRYTKFKIKLSKTDYFPLIRNFEQDDNGLLYIDRWRGDPENHHLLLVLDGQGQEVKKHFSFEAFERVVGKHEGWFYVTDFNNDTEEAGLIRRREEDLEAYVANHPIVFEGSRGRSLTRDQ